MAEIALATLLKLSTVSLNDDVGSSRKASKPAATSRTSDDLKNSSASDNALSYPLA
eukprot:CAMPEP_0182480288 /NCGR_PEP_ID=MMETSP1319-20130603/35556_1 /TAXON_ID=172717 /ORGANISM="Bolidomonas pacifica, Strain RCC208" /LENGTH=55 /DNA_ID=CAMNT_0024681767 /DNA_START=106 /DNA_END=270 /DNA_ORIENTATION=+